MRLTALRLENWRNFRRAEMPLARRVFLVGPNASGKSNLLDAIRFLRDVADPRGGFQEAVDRRRGVSQVRCLHGRQHSDVVIDVTMDMNMDMERDTELHSLAQVAKRVPHATAALLSALQVHGMTSEVPHAVWILIDRKARMPTLVHPRLEVLRASGAARDHGIETRMIEGVPVRLTSLAKTVADCFRYRRHVGLGSRTRGAPCLPARPAGRAPWPPVGFASRRARGRRQGRSDLHRPASLPGGARLKKEGPNTGARVRVRLHVVAGIATAVIRLQIDIGFGDAVTPEPAVVEFPSLLDFPACVCWSIQGRPWSPRNSRRW